MILVFSFNLVAEQTNKQNKKQTNKQTKNKQTNKQNKTKQNKKKTFYRRGKQNPDTIHLGFLSYCLCFKHTSICYQSGTQFTLPMSSIGRCLKSVGKARVAWYRTLCYHSRTVHVRSTFLMRTVPMDGYSFRVMHLVVYVYNYPVIFTHLKTIWNIKHYQMYSNSLHL